MQNPADQGFRKKRKLLIFVLAGIFVFVFIIIPAVAITGLWLSDRHARVSRPPRVVIPNVLGQEYRKGESMLNEKGLRMQVLFIRWDQNQPVGIILDQNPLAGESIEVGQTVTVTIGGKPGQPLPSPTR